MNLSVALSPKVVTKCDEVVESGPLMAPKTTLSYVYVATALSCELSVKLQGGESQSG